VNWYRKSADQGNAVAQFNLGFMYSQGKGVPVNHKEAVKWFRKSADQGDRGAQYQLGLSYSKGKGVPQDFVRAYAWYDLAAAEANKVAIESRDLTMKEMTQNQITKGRELSAQLQKEIDNRFQKSIKK